MAAYYNDNDPFAAAHLRELIAAGLIAPGEVDERDMLDVTPNDLRSFRQCHFFAGIGIWSLAARLAGIPDDAPLWTGSCPCQPFSQAGLGTGFADARHLWPAFHYLIEQCAPPLVTGEQVAGSNGDAWLDHVQLDMDATGYAFGAVETGAASFGAPHERSRNYWMAYRLGSGLEGYPGDGGRGVEPGWLDAHSPRSAAARGLLDRVAHASRIGSLGRAAERGNGTQPGIGDARDGAAGRLAYTNGRIPSDGNAQSGRKFGLQPQDRSDVREGSGRPQPRSAGNMGRPGQTNGFWADVDWLRCRDAKWRPVEPGTFPLVDAGTFRNRMGLLRGAGNAVTLGQAVGWLQAVISSVSALETA